MLSERFHCHRKLFEIRKVTLRYRNTAKRIEIKINSSKIKHLFLINVLDFF